MLKGGWGHDLSIAFGRDAARDLAIVKTVREAVGDDAEIIVDVAAGSGWTASHAITMARAFEPFRLYWLEDALPEGDIDGLETASRRYRDGALHRREGVDRPRLPPTDQQRRARCRHDRSRDVRKGVTGTKKVIDLAADAGMSWNAHSWSSAINTAASLHLAAASPNVLVLELKPEPSPMQNDIVDATRS